MTPKEIMLGCFRGEKVFIEAFEKEYRRVIYSAIKRRLRLFQGHSINDADDFFNDFFVELIDNNFASLRSMRDLDHPWGLISIVAFQNTGRCLIKELEDKRRLRSLVQQIGPVEMSDEHARIFEEAVATLDEEAQEIVRLFHWKRLKYREIAVETGLTTSNVGVIINRANSQMKAFIKRQYPELTGIL